MNYTNIYLIKINELSIKNKYLKWYSNIINNALLRKDLSQNFEIHHIIPDCFFINSKRKKKISTGFLDGNSDDKLNLVKLTFKEHYICHLLLLNMFKDKHILNKLANAIIIMNGFINLNNSKIYNLFKTKIRKLQLKEKIFKNPEGDIVIINDLPKFCIENNLPYKQMLNLSNINSNSKFCCGWTNPFKEINWNFYEFISPNGEYFKIQGNFLKNFCIENELSYNKMRAVGDINSTTIQHKKWTNYNKKQVSIKNKSRKYYKDGVIIEILDLPKFCIENNLSYSNMKKVYSGIINNHKNYINVSYYENIHLSKKQDEFFCEIKGVSYSKSNLKWHSYIKINKKTINLGYFSNKFDAINARKDGELKYLGKLIQEFP